MDCEAAAGGLGLRWVPFVGCHASRDRTPLNEVRVSLPKSIRHSGVHARPCCIGQWSLYQNANM